MAGINVNFNVLNQGGAPAIYENEYGLIPTASLQGRLFVAIDTKELYRDNGVSWDLIGGGGGSPQGLQDVITTDNIFTQNNTIKVNGFNLYFTDVNLLEFESDTNFKFFVYNDPSKLLQLGDTTNNLNNTFFEIDIQGGSISTYNTGGPNGFQLDLLNDNYTFGNISNANYLSTSGTGNYLLLNCTQPIRLNDNGSGNFLDSSASGSSGQHLIIYINGTQYKIALLNP